ncbi:kinase-like protein, partial [Tilletiopsis washingtonensis]
EEDDPMADPKQATLARLRLARLAELCEERDIDTKGKKAFLIDRLLQHHRARTAAAAPSSQATAGKKGKGKVRPVVANAPGRKRSAAHVPLLLRSHSRQTLASKPDSPALDPCNPDAAPAEAVDELNGLDLESLNLLDKEIPPHRLEKLEKIGSGGFKDVYVGKYFHQKSRAQKVAIADIRDDLTEMDIKELSLLRDLRHENIVRFIGVSIPDAPRHVPCMIVSELCTNGDLFDYIRNVPAPSNDDIFRIMLETARGIEYLHGRDPAIIHRDIKSTNILITRDRHAKINDFGLARVKNTRRSMMRSLVGTVNWQAAELWRPKPHYNEKVDVWSVAMTFWETLQWHEKVKKYPFEGMNEHQIYLEVGGDKRVRPKTTNVRKLFGDGIVELLERMWDAQPRLRPTMSDVCAELERLIAE